MELGTGIFLSTVVLAVLILYAITKDRWRWRRIVVCIALIFLLLTGIISGGLYFWNQLPMLRLVPQTEYAGLRLGISPAEVMYIKGTPSSVLTADDPVEFEKDHFVEVFWDLYFLETKDLVEKGKKGKYVGDYREWRYEDDQTRIDVAFNPEKTAVIAIRCSSKNILSRCPSMAGVFDGDSEKDVIRKLGSPDASRVELGTKSLYYRTLGIRLRLAKEQVYMLRISDPKYEPQ